MPPTFERSDGSPGRVDRAAEIDQDAPIPEEAPVVAQVSRWDRLKDPGGVLRGFAEHCENEVAHLLVAGPSVAAVSDDPEGAEVLAEVRELRVGPPAAVRARVHLACLPMDDVEENAAIVNAIQRRAQVVVQKSLAEGFGLTVAEAMWKARPVVASRAGGIQDQIVDGVTGVLLDDPLDLARFGRACDELLGDPERADRDRRGGPRVGDRALSRLSPPGPVPAPARRAAQRPATGGRDLAPTPLGRGTTITGHGRRAHDLVRDLTEHGSEHRSERARAEHQQVELDTLRARAPRRGHLAGRRVRPPWPARPRCRLQPRPP